MMKVTDNSLKTEDYIRKVREVSSETKKYVKVKKVFSRSKLTSVCKEILLLCLEKEKQSVDEYKLWYISESDSNPTEFERYGQEGKIYLKTRLSESDESNNNGANIVMGIFQMLWDDNFYFYDSSLSKEDMVSYVKRCIDGENDIDENTPDEEEFSPASEIELLKGNCSVNSKVYTIEDIIQIYCDPYIM